MEIEVFIDRIEGGKAVLMDDEEREAVLPISWIPDAHEGEALMLTVTAAPEREADARAEAEALLKELTGE